NTALLNDERSCVMPSDIPAVLHAEKTSNAMRNMPLSESFTPISNTARPMTSSDTTIIAKARFMDDSEICVRNTSVRFFLRATLATFNTATAAVVRSEEHTSELQSRENLVCRLLLEKKKFGSN